MTDGPTKYEPPGRRRKAPAEPPPGAAVAGFDDTEPEALPDAGSFDGGLDAWCAWQPCNDLGNARRLRARFGADLRWVPEAGWLAWNGVCWSLEEGETRAHLAAQKTAEAVRAEAQAIKDGYSERAGTLRAWANESGGSGRISAMQREARPHLVAHIRDFDRDDTLFGCANGVLDVGIETRLRPSRREDLMTKASPVAYDPKAEAPVFLAFVEKVLPDADVRRFVQMFFGYCMTGSIAEQVMVLFLGDGSNGKSTLVNCVRRAMGDYAFMLPIESLLLDERRQGAAATPDIAQLPARRFVTASEPDIGAKLSESRVKQMTGGEPMPARHLNRDMFEFDPKFKLLASANNKPTIKGADDGIWRRIRLVPFVAKVTSDDVGAVYAALEAEAAGILNWMVAGAEMWCETGLSAPAAVAAAGERYRRESNPIGEFVNEWLIRGRGGDLQSQALYGAYKAWCHLGGDEPVSATKFGYKMTDLGIEKDRTGGRVYYRDVRLTDAAQATMEEAAQGSTYEPPGDL